MAKLFYDDACTEEAEPWLDIHDREGNPMRVGDREVMICMLVMDGVAFFSATTLQPCAMLNDTFAYACADAEVITWEELPGLYAMHEQDKSWGVVRWAILKRKCAPI